MAERRGTDTTEKGGVESYIYTDGSIHPLNRPGPEPLKHGLSACLRLLTLGATLAAFVVMVTNKQTVSLTFAARFRPRTFRTEYQFFSAFVWFAIATAIAFVYSLAAMVVEACVVSKDTRSSYFLWLIFGLDLIMVNVLMSACAAGLAVELLGHKGNNNARWTEFCSDFGSFCDHVTGALVAGAVGLAGLIELCILDAYHLFTQYTRF